MKHIFASTLALSLALASGGCSQETGLSTPAMINGSPAAAGQFGSTVVYLLPNAVNKADPNMRCTGVKVSPRFLLTAAHCLVGDDGLLNSNLYKPNAKLEISNFGERDTGDTSLWHSGYIKNIRTSPGYEEALTACYEEAVNAGRPALCRDRWDMPAELALVEFNADLPSQWPTAKLDLNPVFPGETVSLVGYGHQEGRYTVEPKVKKKYSNEVVRDWDEMKPLITEADVDSKVAAMSAIAFVTRGFMHPSADIGTTAGLMPGDSGGPVYRLGTNNVVGIHRAVYFDGNDWPLFHLHSRLSSANDFLRRYLPASSFAN